MVCRIEVRVRDSIEDIRLVLPPISADQDEAVRTYKFKQSREMLMNTEDAAEEKETSSASTAEAGMPPPLDLYHRLATITVEEARVIIGRIDPKFINKQHAGGGSLLTWAAEFHRHDIAEILLEHGAGRRAQ